MSLLLAAESIATAVCNTAGRVDPTAEISFGRAGSVSIATALRRRAEWGAPGPPGASKPRQALRRVAVVAPGTT
jgi:hypothetical protein